MFRNSPHRTTPTPSAPSATPLAATPKRLPPPSVGEGWEGGATRPAKSTPPLSSPRPTRHPAPPVPSAPPVIPAQIQRSMAAFRAGEFVGADRSPIAYVGYHVGKTNGLPVRDREQRLLVCFRIDSPSDLIADYRDWAGPASRQRPGKMRGHCKMLAAMRRDRPGFKVAVAE